jgi:haloalkane dehalogenase
MALVDAFRTPDDRFDGLPGYGWEPQYRDWEGLRMAHLDEGDGDPVVLFHGEPTWSYLYRKVMPPLLEAGYRCIAPDYAGFGRSDKPAEFGWYSYDRHTESMLALVEELAIADATFVVHDWGGPVGMRVAAERPESCARLVVMDTGFFTGEQRMTDAWKAFRDFVERTEDLPVGFLVKGACHTDPGEEVVAAYEAPYPDAASKAGARAFPLMLPTSPDAPGAAEGRKVRDAMVASGRPALVLWADSDPIIPPETGRILADRTGWPEPEIVPDASHFLQEDQGELIGKRIASWLVAG